MVGKLLRENIRTEGALGLNALDRILAEGRPGWSDTTDGGMKNLMRYWGSLDMYGGGSF